MLKENGMVSYEDLYEHPYNEIFFSIYNSHNTCCPYCTDGNIIIKFNGSPADANPKMFIITECCFLKIRYEIKNNEWLKLVHKRMYFGLRGEDKDIFCKILIDEIEKAKDFIANVFIKTLGDRVIIEV